MLRSSIMILILGVGLTIGCEETETSPIGARKIDESCVLTSECAAGFTCVSKACVALAPIPEQPYRGSPCAAHKDCSCPNGAQCSQPLFCGPQDVCTLSEGLDEGQACGLTINCKRGLICNGATSTCTQETPPVNELGIEMPGYADLGESCATLVHCRRPYVCGLNNLCAKIPFFKGATCSRTTEELGAFRVYFELPPESIFDKEAETDADFEFYRLPFPNNIRRKEGRISLKGHPHPGEILGVNVKTDYFDAIENDVNGFGVDAPIFFRLSDRINPESICLDPGSIYPDLSRSDPFQFSQSGGNAEEETITFCKDQGEPTIFLVNLDEVDTSERSAIPLQLNLSTDSGQYICDNWIGVASLEGAPLEHGTTYALIITDGIRSEWGDAPIQDRDFRDILSGSLSSEAMQPLLNWLTSSNIPTETIAGASVFTTADPDAHAEHLRKAVRQSSPQPTFGESFLCDNNNAPGPCPTTACRPTPSNFFYEMRGTYNTPLFQTGTRPYKTPLDGGSIPRKSGVPLAPTQSESVCFSASIPKHILPPAKGWPVVIFAHGSGGSFATLTQQAFLLAEALAVTGFAAISFDGLLHGKRGGTETPPSLSDPTSFVPSSQYFFNLINPQASRDNVLQGSADLFQVVNLIQKDPGGLTKALKGAQLDPTRIYFIGHSQGATVASAFIAAETALKGAVLAGVGADTGLKVLNQESPLSLKTVAGFLFADTNLTRIHPMMGALSTLLGESDMGSYARTYVHNPIVGRSPHSLLVYSGLNDTYAPTLTHNALIRMMQIPLVGPALSPISGVAHTPQSPVSANVKGVTAGAVQFSSGSSGLCPPLCDGHFVLLNSPEALQTLTTFLTTDTIQR